METKKYIKNLSITIPLLGTPVGGGLRVITELANGLSSRGHYVTLVTPPFNNFPFPLSHRVKILCRNDDGEKSNIIKRLKDYIFVLRTTCNADGIIISNYYLTFFIGYVARIFKNLKHVYFIQGYEPEFFDENFSLLSSVKSMLARLSYSLKADLRITISKFISDKISKDDIVIINDGVDVNVFKAASNNNSKNNNKIVICSIALSIKRKGFHDFVKAIDILFKKRTDFEVLLFSSELNLNLDLPFPFTLKFPTNDVEVVDCLQKSDIFVSSSHKEGFGLPGLEAMACGAALITTNSGGVTQYARHEINSLIVEIKNVEMLVSAIERLLDDNLLMHSIKQEGLITAKQFTWEIMSENFSNELMKL